MLRYFLKRLKIIFPAWCIVTSFLVALYGVPVCRAMKVGDEARAFSLQDLNGKAHDLSAMRTLPMTVVYFFDTQSRPSQDGILIMDRLVNKFKDTGFAVWGITRSPRDKVTDYVAKAKPGFPILLDTANVCDLYQARFILPTACVLGPDLKVIDFIQGGGKSMNTRLTKLAETRFMQKQPASAVNAADNTGGKADDAVRSKEKASAETEKKGSAKTSQAKSAKQKKPQKSPAEDSLAVESEQDSGKSRVKKSAADAENNADTVKPGPIQWGNIYGQDNAGSQGSQPAGGNSQQNPPPDSKSLFRRGGTIQ